MCVLNFTRWKICRSEYFVDLSKTKFDDGGYGFCNSLMSWMGSFQHHHFRRILFETLDDLSENTSLHSWNNDFTKMIRSVVEVFGGNLGDFVVEDL